MAKDVITVDGKEVVVREDTAKAYRGVKWAIIVIVIGLAIMAVVAIGFYLRASRNGNLESLAQINNSSVR